MRKHKILTASLLVAGTAIGAGMLALPVTTAEGGFWPAIVMYVLCVIFSAATGLLLLEASLWLPKDSNIISLSSHLLGKKGKIAAWLFYIFLFYSLTIAYVAGGGGIIHSIFKEALAAPLSILLFVLIFSPVVYIGTHAVDRLNSILMLGLIVSFIAFVLIVFGKVELSLLEHVNWKVAFFALPVLFTAFSYQGIIPSMRAYFEGKPNQVRKVILIGSAIPFVIYAIWEYLILGTVPLTGPDGLLEAKAQGQTAVAPLKVHARSDLVYAIGQAFGFFALTTSFLGVTLGLFDFFADGLNIPKKGINKLYLYLVVYGPATLIAMFYPGIFIRALGYAGGLGCAILLGLFPVLMVWSGRYRKKLTRRYEQLPGGKISLLLIVAFIIFELSFFFVDKMK